MTKSMMLALLAALAGLAFPAAAAGAADPPEAVSNTLRLEESARPAPAEIADLAWLVGYWKGSGLGGVAEELWMPPTTNRMYGTFTLVKEGAVVFSEAMMLIEEEGSVVLRVKHFDPEFVGWEEKDGFVTFRLVRMAENEANFHGLTFRRSGDELEIFLVLHKDGEQTEHSFELKRKAL